MDAPVKDISLSLVRTIKAPPERVFAAWTDPQALKIWFAPTDAYTVLSAETDARIGGRYRIVMRDPAGDEHRVGGAYQEIVANRKLVFTWAWEATPENESYVTVDLRAVGAGTELTLTHVKFVDEKTREMHNQGWIGCLDHLERMLAA